MDYIDNLLNDLTRQAIEEQEKEEGFYKKLTILMARLYQCERLMMNIMNDPKTPKDIRDKIEKHLSLMEEKFPLEKGRPEGE